LTVGGVVRDRFSKRVSTPDLSEAIIVERTVDVPTDKPATITAVAHETTSDSIGATRLEIGSLKSAQGARVTPIAVLQPASAAVVAENGTLRQTTPLAIGGEVVVDPARPTALVTVACGSVDADGSSVSRTLEGESRIEFGTSPIDRSTGPCVQIRDVIPASTLGPGAFRYRVSVHRGADELAASEQAFRVNDPSSTAAR